MTTPPLLLRNVFFGLALLCAFAWTGGCSSHAPPVMVIIPEARPVLVTTGLQPAAPIQAVQTVSPIPTGWTLERLKHSSEHDHQAWLSPTRSTAYGIIAFHSWLLPFASDRMVLDKFLQTMKQSEGEAKLLGLERSPKADGVRFVAEGGQYRIRAHLVTRGSRGWVVYAGTLRSRPVNEPELDVAERARDQTTLGLPPDVPAR